MQSNKGFIGLGALIAIVLGLIIVGGGAYYVMHQNAAPATQPSYPDLSNTQPGQQQTTTNTSVQATTNTTAATQQPVSQSSTQMTTPNSQLATYSNAQYGFAIDFPANDPAKTVDYGSFHPFSSAPIVYSGYWITVNASNNPTDVANCTVVGAIHNVYDGSTTQPDSTYSKTINDINFAVSDWHDNAPSYERDYTAVHNGTCFDIQLITVPSCSLCADGRPTLESYKPQLDAMDKIAQTFRFINPSQVVAPTVQVDGMSKYTESTFGYTFWYPNSWTVNQISVQNPQAYGGGTVVKTLQLSNGTKSIYIDQFQSSDDSIEDTNPAGGTYSFATDVVYAFDPNAHVWTINFPSGQSFWKGWSDANTQGTHNPVPITDYDVTTSFNNTMGGLHTFRGKDDFSDTIIPLSAHNFLVVRTQSSRSDNSYISILDGLVETVGATDANVATPISPYDQISDIQQEKAALTGSQ